MLLPAAPRGDPIGVIDFMEEEDVLLLEAKTQGKPWSEIANMLPERGMKALKRQYTILQKPRVRLFLPSLPTQLCWPGCVLLLCWLILMHCVQEANAHPAATLTLSSCPGAHTAP